jgi:hypothetical protein
MSRPPVKPPRDRAGVVGHRMGAGLAGTIVPGGDGHDHARGL